MKFFAKAEITLQTLALDISEHLTRYTLNTQM